MHTDQKQTGLVSNPPVTGTLHRRFLLKWLLIGCALRTFVTLVMHYGSVLAGSSGFFFLDDQTYHLQGIYLSSFFRAGLWNIPIYNATFIGSLDIGYPTLLGTLYALVGPSLLVAKMLNVLFGVCTIASTYYLALSLFNPVVARRSTVAFALFPNTMFWGAMLLRDTLITCLAVTATCLLVRAAAGNHRWPSLVGVFGCLGLLMTLRGFLAGALLLSYVVYLLANKQRWRLLLAFVSGIVALGAALSATGAFLHNYVSFYQTVYTGLGTDLASTAIGVGSLVKGMAVTLTNPLPWTFDAEFPVVYALFPGQWIWLIGLPLIAGGAWYMLRKKADTFLLLMIPMVLVSALYIRAYGDAGARQFVPWYAYAFILAAYGLEFVRRPVLFIGSWTCVLPLLALIHLGLTPVAVALCSVYLVAAVVRLYPKLKHPLSR